MVRLAILPLAVAVLTALATSAAIADDQRPSLAAELGWVKFRVSAGKIHVVNTNYRENKEYETGNPLVGESERISMLVSARETIVRYEHRTPDETLGVVFSGRDALTIERRQVGDRAITPFTFTQRRDEGLQLAVGEGEGRKVYRGRTFWHLLLLSPEPTREHLVPVLDSLRPGWQLEETAADLEAALVAASASGRWPDRENWAKLVDALGSPRFSERRAAERQLRAAGPAVVAFLQSLEIDDYDAERRARIDRLLDSLSTTADDMPDRIALWLVDDPTIWLAILASDKLEHRRAAHAQLEKLLAMKIDFDPAADDVLRQPQVEAVRRRIAP